MFDLRKLDKIIYLFLVSYAITSSISIAASSLFIGLAAFCGILRQLRSPIDFSLSQGIIKAMVIFFLTSSISIFFAHDPIAGLNTLGALVFRTLPFFLAIGFVREKKQFIAIIVGMTISIFIADLYAVWQGVHGNFRAQAFSGHPMILAGYLIQMIPVLLILSLEQSLFCVKKRKFIAFVLILSILALLFNGTRGAWLAVLGTFFLYGIYEWKKRDNPKVIVGVVLVSALLTFTTVIVPGFKDRVDTITDKSYQSNSERLLVWKGAWSMFLDHPITGVGLGNFEKMYQEQYMSSQAVERLGHAHNNFLQILADRGIVGFLGFLYLFGYILFNSYRNSKESFVGTAMFFVTVCFLFQGFTEYNAGNSAVTRMFWFLLGLYCASYNYKKCKDMTD